MLYDELQFAPECYRFTNDVTISLVDIGVTTSLPLTNFDLFLWQTKVKPALAWECRPGNLIVASILSDYSICWLLTSACSSCGQIGISWRQRQIEQLNEKLFRMKSDIQTLQVGSPGPFNDVLLNRSVNTNILNLSSHICFYHYEQPGHRGPTACSQYGGPDYPQFNPLHFETQLCSLWTFLTDVTCGWHAAGPSNLGCPT